MGAEPEVHGALAVAETFSERAQAARLAQIDGQVGAVWAPGSKPRVVFQFTIEGDHILEIALVADEATIAHRVGVGDAVHHRDEMGQTFAALES